MSSLEYYGINRENVEMKCAELFAKGQAIVVARTDEHHSHNEVLLSFKSNNNDVCLNTIASEVSRVFAVPRMDKSIEGKYLVLRRA